MRSNYPALLLACLCLTLPSPAAESPEDPQPPWELSPANLHATEVWRTLHSLGPTGAKFEQDLGQWRVKLALHHLDRLASADQAKALYLTAGGLPGGLWGISSDLYLAWVRLAPEDALRHALGTADPTVPLAESLRGPDSRLGPEEEPIDGYRFLLGLSAYSAVEPAKAMELFDLLPPRMRAYGFPRTGNRPLHPDIQASDTPCAFELFHHHVKLDPAGTWAKVETLAKSEDSPPRELDSAAAGVLFAELKRPGFEMPRQAARIRRLLGPILVEENALTHLAYRILLEHWMATDPLEAIRWTQANGTPAAGSQLRAACLGYWFRSTPATAGAWLRAYNGDDRALVLGALPYWTPNPAHSDEIPLDRHLKYDLAFSFARNSSETRKALDHCASLPTDSWDLVFIQSYLDEEQSAARSRLTAADLGQIRKQLAGLIEAYEEP